MSSFGVILDACVLIPAALRDTLLRAASDDMYRLYWTEDILSEVERNLSENYLTIAPKASHLVSTMRHNFPESIVDGYQSLIPTMTNHEKDRHVLAAAVVSGAQVIVTSNLRDFPEGALEPFGIEAQSPDQFLEHLLDLDTEKLLLLLEQQADALWNPPMTMDEVVSKLACTAPCFAKRVRDAMVEAGIW